jgi:hypothetical protein
MHHTTTLTRCRRPRKTVEGALRRAATMGGPGEWRHLDNRPPPLLPITSTLRPPPCPAPPQGRRRTPHTAPPHPTAAGQACAGQRVATVAWRDRLPSGGLAVRATAGGHAVVSVARGSACPSYSDAHPQKRGEGACGLRTLFTMSAAALYFVTTSELDKSVTADSSSFTSSLPLSDIVGWGRLGDIECFTHDGQWRRAGTGTHFLATTPCGALTVGVLPHLRRRRHAVCGTFLLCPLPAWRPPEMAPGCRGYFSSCLHCVPRPTKRRQAELHITHSPTHLDHPRPPPHRAWGASTSRTARIRPTASHGPTTTARTERVLRVRRQLPALTRAPGCSMCPGPGSWWRCTRCGR